MVVTDDRNDGSRFQSLLTSFNIESLQYSSETIYGLWPTLTLAYLNVGWKRFSSMNGGEPKITSEWPLGRCVLDAVSEPLRPFFAENYRRCLEDGRPWEHTYECSSADTLREFHMTAFPLGKSEGLLVINSLRREAVHTSVVSSPLDEHYRNEHGIVTQCSHCRRVRRTKATQVWDWVPAWVSTPPANTSHGLCEPCFGFYYAEQPQQWRGSVQPFKTFQ